MNQINEQLALVSDWLKMDFSKTIIENFNRIAKTLFNDWVIQVNENRYRFIEIEFYYKSKDHCDVYTHSNDMQLTSGRWYFHGAGVDLTFGEKYIYGGILIRSIEKISPKEKGEQPRYIFGPLNVQVELLHNLPSAFDSQAKGLQLVRANKEVEKLDDNAIISCYRHNISQSKEGGADYHKQHYRYLVHPKLAYKDKTGIAQSLLEQKGASVQAFDEIKEIMGGELLGKERKTFNQKNS